MKCNYVTITITRDPMTKIPKVVAPWEVPIYRSQYGDSNVQITEKQTEVEISELPDTEGEYMRLRDVFGIEPDTKQSHVDLVYGRGAQAIEPLEKAIKASVAGDYEAAQKVVDGKGGPGKETLEAREKAKETNTDDAMVNQPPVPDTGMREPRGLGAVVAEASDANKSASTEAANATLMAAGKAAAESLAKADAPTGMKADESNHTPTAKTAVKSTDK